MLEMLFPAESLEKQRIHFYGIYVSIPEFFI